MEREKKKLINVNDNHEQETIIIQNFFILYYLDSQKQRKKSMFLYWCSEVLALSDILANYQSITAQRYG